MPFLQCKLTKTEGPSRLETVSYIPKKFAQKNRILDLRDEEGNWTRDWRVDFVGHEVADPPDWRHAIKAHRRATGDSLPKTHS